MHLRHGGIVVSLRMLHGEASMHMRESRGGIVGARLHHEVVLVVQDLGRAGWQADLDSPGMAALPGGGKGGHLVLHIR